MAGAHDGVRSEEARVHETLVVLHHLLFGGIESGSGGSERGGMLVVVR